MSVLRDVTKLARQQLLKSWAGPLWVSLMLWDDGARRLPVVAGVRMGEEIDEWDLSKLTLRYGEGIAGRAFKASECRLYQHCYDREPATAKPTFYVKVEGEEPEAVLLSIPLRSPKFREHVYGVVNLSSPEADCPLYLAGVDKEPPDKEFNPFWEVMDRGVLSGLDSITKKLKSET